jgi:NADPH:quinone reductase-like Zn-dependent oxidoreductase
MRLNMLQVGEDVTNVKVGQRVYPLLSKTAETDQGTWQEYVIAPALKVIPIPDSVSDESASQFFGNPWTGVCVCVCVCVYFSLPLN